MADWAQRPSAQATITIHKTVVVAGTCGGLSGTVSYGSSSTPLAFAEVDICGSDRFCIVVNTDENGSYSASPLPADLYTVTARPGIGPPVSDLVPATGSVSVLGQNVTLDFNLLSASIPPGVTVNGQSGKPGQIFTVFNGSPFTVTASGCRFGTAQLTIRTGSVVFFDGAMTETPGGSGEFSVTVPGGHPGFSMVTITYGGCTPARAPLRFPLFIDPSGTVQDSTGAPIPGATVTLLRSDTAGGAPTPVPDGSMIMSLVNRNNPTTADGAGHFGWDVIAGYYSVQASAPGCTTASSPLTRIPPPVVGLILTLNCPGVVEHLSGGPIEARRSLIAEVATFTTPLAGAGPGDFEATIDWGDGASSPGIVTQEGATAFTVNGAHDYRHNGTYLAAISVSGPRNRAVTHTSVTVRGGGVTTCAGAASQIIE